MTQGLPHMIPETTNGFEEVEMIIRIITNLVGIRILTYPYGR